MQIVPAEGLRSFPIEPSRPLLVVPQVLFGIDESDPADTTGAASTAGETGAVGPIGPIGEPVPGRHARRDSGVAVLRRLYPADHAVGRFGASVDTIVSELTDKMLTGPLYLPPANPDLATASPWSLPWIADRLRRPDGCPWDREQTHVTLKKHLLEEAYEVYDAIGEQATPALAGELGDLLLQIVLHAQLAAEAGVFDMSDVQAEIGRKIVRRHPHVFGDAIAHTASDVNRQWEQIKKAERERAEAEGEAPPRSALDGIPRAMPALAAAQEMQERAAHLGYDWPDIVGVIDKIHEELSELESAATAQERHEEIGDLLLVVTNLARRNGVDAEDALRAAAEKFRRRFRRVERMARERNVQLRGLGLAELDQLWDAAKVEERAEAAVAQGDPSDAAGLATDSASSKETGR